MLYFPSFQDAIATVPGMGVPEPWQLDQINQYRPKGRPPLKAQDVISVPMLASHNLMSYTNAVWSTESLEAMAALYPGRQVNLNHTWEDVQKNIGLIFSAYLIQTPDAPTNILNAANFFDVNRQIVANDGFQFLLGYGAFPKDSPAISAIDYRLARDVSTGAVTDGTWICPVCDAEFFTQGCSHWPPHPELLQWMGDDDEIEFAPYYIRSGLHTAIEITSCVAGNLPGAEILCDSKKLQSIAESDEQDSLTLKNPQAVESEDLLVPSS